jgi:hypothetical protein
MIMKSRIMGLYELKERALDKLYDVAYNSKEYARDKLTNSAIHIVTLLNRYKDRSLAFRLHDLADQYDPRPTGQWQH